MKMHIHRLALPLANEFTISRGSQTETRALIVELQHQGQSGFGEVTENSYYGHTLEAMQASLERCRSKIESEQIASGEAMWNLLHTDLADDSFALSAVDLASHDLFGKLKNEPCFRLWGLDWQNIPASSFTIGIAPIETMVARLRDQPGWSIYKIKLGGENDEQVVRALREQTDATFRVDANCAWTPDEAIAKSHLFKSLGVEFIEQPLPADSPRADHQRVYNESVLPIIADENCIVESDVANCHGVFHGINVKLCKCGGLTPALRMLREARSLKMKTMVGCMVETSIGISAAAQLLPLLDYADLDGAILLGNDPASGVILDRGEVRLSDVPGCGSRFNPATCAYTIAS